MSIKSNTITLDQSQIISLEENAVINPYNVKDSGLENYGGSNANEFNAKRDIPLSKKSRLEQSLDKLAKLISNITESHTTAIFVADQQAKILHSLAHHSLSRDYIENVEIPYGCGLVGWTAENKVRITVCPFEHNARTLLYYPTDQGLKSFIAVPILDKNNDLIGVIACDSKKNYAFAKITEKILTDCAIQAQLLIELHLDNQKLQLKSPKPTLKNDLEKVLEDIKSCKSEEQLFDTICKTPQSIIAREAMIALVTSFEGYGESTFYSNANENRTEHHLVDLVCKHKKILSTERSVHVLPNDDIKARSFLSVPFHVHNREAGALNVLSAAFKGFSPSDIEALEKLAKAVGSELERLRSRNLINSRQIGPSLLPWKHFINYANKLIGIGNDSKLNKASSTQYCLLRIQLNNLFNLEQLLGVKNVAEIHEQIVRFVQQLAAQPMSASSPYGTSTYVIGEVSQIENLVKRLSSVISKIPYMNNLEFYEKLPENASEIIGQNIELRKIELKSGISSVLEAIQSPNIIGLKVEVSQVEVKKPTAAQIPQNSKNNVISNSSFSNLKNTFDQRLSQALRSQEENKIQNKENNTPEEDFVLGESNEIKEVANARFW